VRFYLAALILWAAVIFIFSSIPNPPDAGGGDWRYELAHVFEYAVFGALAFFTLKKWLPIQPLEVLVIAAWSVSVLYGMSDELHQSFVPNRDASWLDVGYDAIGAALGIVGALRLSVRSSGPVH
jgi:VanZ family protein